MKKIRKRKWLAVLLVVSMVILYMPVNLLQAYADDDAYENVDPVDGQFQVRYDGRNNAQVEVDGKTFVDGQIQEFVAGTLMNITLIAPREDMISPKVRVYDSNNIEGYSDITPTQNEEKWNFSYTPSEDAVISFSIYWTEEEFNYGEFGREDKHYIIELSACGHGHIELPEEITSQDYRELFDSIKVRTDAENISFRLVPDPGENHFEELEYEIPYSVQDIIAGNKPEELSYNLDTNTVNINFESYKEDGEYRDYYGMYRFNFTGFQEEPQEPQNPSLRMNFDDHQMTVSATGLGNLERDRDYEYPQEESIVLTFRPMDSNEFYGIIVRENENEEREYIKKQNLGDNDRYQYTIPNLENSYEIEVVTWKEPFDNEYMIFYDGDDEAKVSSNNNVLMDAQLLSFTKDNQINFILTKPKTQDSNPYKVLVQVNDEDDTHELEVTQNSCSYTPTSNKGFTIQVYWTEEQYEYDHLNANYDNDEYSVECITIDASSEEVEIVVPSGAKSARYKNLTKMVLQNQQNITVNITPKEGRTIHEIRCGGATVAPQEYADTDKGGTYIYFWSVDKDHTKELEISLKDIDGNESGENEPGNNSTNYVGAKEAIEADDYAYFGTKENITEYLAQEIWYQYMVTNHNGHTGLYAGMFDSQNELQAKITLSNQTSTEGSKLTKNNEAIPYYSYTLTLKEADLENNTQSITASGCVYQLRSNKDIVVKHSYCQNGLIIDRYEVVTTTGFLEDVTACGSYDMDERGDARISVFGNGVDIDGRLLSGVSQYCNAYHVTTGHTNNAGSTDINCRVIVINSNFVGVKLNGNKANGSAAAWGFASVPVYATAGSTSTNPTLVDVYIGDTKIKIDPFIQGDSSAITNVECTLENAERAVSIIENDGSYTIKPLSNFYDEIPLKITYEGNPTPGYLTIRLVAIAMAGSRTTPNSHEVPIFHGTDHETKCTLDQNENAIVSASFYYPEDADPEDGKPRVEMFATYTWANGSITRTRISETVNADLITNANQGSAHVDDFLLWKGNADNAPKKIEVIAILPEINETSFAGAKFGSGAGVVWNNNFN